MTQPSGRVPAPEPLPADALDAHCHLDLIEQPVGEVLADGLLNQVQVTVSVERVGRQRLGRRNLAGRLFPVPRRAGRGHDCSSRASSSSTTDASSLANSGRGTASGVPGRTGTDAHRGTLA